MSPADRQDGPETPQPFFARVDEAPVEVTGLFEPRPEEVKPWSLFERAEDAPEPAFVDPDPIGTEEAQGEHSDADAPDTVGEPVDEAPAGAELSGDEDAEGLDVQSHDDALAPEGPPVAETEAPAQDALPGASEEGPESLLESPDDVAALLDETLSDVAEGSEPEPEPEPEVPCPNCEAVQAAAESTIDATIEALQLPYLEGAEALTRVAQDVSKDFVQNLLRLSVALAGTILRRTAELDPSVALGSLEGALEIAGPLSEVALRCHPDDAELLREQGAARAEAITGRLVDVQVRPADGVERGACIVDFGDGLVDARWQVQLDRLADAISPTLIHHASETSAGIVAETMTPLEDLPLIAQPEVEEIPGAVEDDVLVAEEVPAAASEASVSAEDDLAEHEEGAE